MTEEILKDQQETPRDSEELDEVRSMGEATSEKITHPSIVNLAGATTTHEKKLL